MEKDPFKEYLRESEPDKAHKGYAWSTAIGLQAVDGLKPSKYLIDTAIQNIEGKIPVLLKFFLKQRFHFPRTSILLSIANSFREFINTPERFEITTSQRMGADGATVMYGSASELRATLEYDFSQEKDFGDAKVDIQDEKVDIESVLSEKSSDFSVKTTVHNHRLFEKFGFDEVFGRSAVMELLELKSSGASKLLANLTQAEIIEPVSGHGKGKYKFKGM